MIKTFKPLRKLARLCAMLSLCLTPFVSAQEHASIEQLRFVTTNAEFTLLHEMGHMLICTQLTHIK